MHYHGKGPKFVLVKRYMRWQRGELQAVEGHFRGKTPKLSIRKSRHQLELGLEGSDPT